MPVIAGAQSRIASDETTDGVRTVSTKEYPCIVDDTYITTAYGYVKTPIDSGYMVAMVFQYDGKPWYIREGSPIKFENLDGTPIYIKSPDDYFPERTSTGYQTSILCRIPADKVEAFAKGIKTVTAATHMLTDDSSSRIQFTYNYASMKPLYEAFKELQEIAQ